MPLAAGTVLGPYEIVAPLGAGGMGEVYRARDKRLERDVAIKVLPAHLASSPDRMARFEREAKAVAGLNHPNIVVLYSIEEAGATRFLTMELVEGQGLDQQLVPGGLPIARVLELGIALADALGVAHDKGVVHRDLKPANVMVTREGWVKVLDFGLAKLARPEQSMDLTQAETVVGPLSGDGLVLGTVPYMAPEQIRGEPVDPRTDLFALGILLYEIAVGRRPFAGATPADTTSAILRDQPESLARARRDLPEGLGSIVSRCLEKDPRARFQTALEVANELRRLRTRLERGEASVAPRPARDKAASIAVLPFVNRSASTDDEYFSDGLADELLNVLAKIQGLRVTARTSSFYFKNRSTTIAEIGKALDVATVLEGSVRKAGNRARVSVQLVNVADSSHLWSETYDRTLDDIFAVQDEIAQSVVKELRAKLLGEALDSATRGEVKAEVAAVPAHSADREAYDLYLRGRHQLSRRSHDSLHRAVDFFSGAIARDPSYALAHVGLAEANALLGFHEFEAPREAFPRARAAADRALELIPELGAAYGVLGYTAMHHDREWEVAERHFRRGIQLDPDHSTMRLWFVNLLIAHGRSDEALEQGRLARELDPLSIINNLVMGWVHFFERRFDVAFEKMTLALELEPAFFQAMIFRASSLMFMGRPQEASEQFLAAARVAQHPPVMLGCRAMGTAVAGRLDECRDIVTQMIAMRSERHVSAYYIAFGFACLGDLDAADEWIERAAEERSPFVNYLRLDPRVEMLRGRPRIQAIIARLGQGA